MGVEPTGDGPTRRPPVLKTGTITGSHALPRLLLITFSHRRIKCLSEAHNFPREKQCAGIRAGYVFQSQCSRKCWLLKWPNSDYNKDERQDSKAVSGCDFKAPDCCATAMANSKTLPITGHSRCRGHTRVSWREWLSGFRDDHEWRRFLRPRKIESGRRQGPSCCRSKGM